MTIRLLLPCLLLIALFVTPADAAVKKVVKKRYSPCKISYPSDARVEWECYRLKRKETLESLFGERWQDVARFNRIDRRHAWPGMTLRLPKRLDDIKDFTPLPAIFPAAEKDEKFILVDLTEQFLGAYEKGRLVFSYPIASGDSTYLTPTGEFQVTAYSRNHVSSLYKIEKTTIPYPMHYALRFFINRKEVAFWIHGRDVPGYPASHGCVGLYDEEMQQKYYKFPKEPVLKAARTLYEWAIAPNPDDGGLNALKNGPRVLIIGESPI
ncbi:MAG TPA: L,D-transpeptidase family protein [Geobacteraceae bacterium]|nr:L,D-transpeptidase family protein [Geobacteraceae bacterium]